MQKSFSEITIFFHLQILSLRIRLFNFSCNTKDIAQILLAYFCTQKVIRFRMKKYND